MGPQRRRAQCSCIGCINLRLTLVTISGLRGEVALNEEVIFSIVNDLAKDFPINSAALYIKIHIQDVK